LLVTGSWHEGCLLYYGAARPIVAVADWREGRVPKGCQRLVYVGGRHPRYDVENLKEEFKTIPVKHSNMYYYIREIQR
jgi:hypothetical protein